MPTESELRHNPGLDPLPDVDALKAENAKLREALARAREDLYYLGESDELLAPAVERIDAALAALK